MSASTQANPQNTQEVATNNQVASDNGGVALGAYSSGNVINVTSSDLQALQAALDSNTAIASGNTNAGAAAVGQALYTVNNLLALNYALYAQTNQQLSNTAGVAIASNTDVAENSNATVANVAGASVAASLQALNASLNYGKALDASSSSTTTQALNVAGAGVAAASAATTNALTAVTTTAGTAIASNLQALNSALNSNNQVSVAAINAGATATQTVAATALGALSAVAGSNANANALAASSINAIIQGSAQSDSLLSSVINSFTGALSNTTQGAEVLAGNALNGAIAVSGNQAIPVPQGVAQPSMPNAKWLLIGAVALIAVLVISKE